MRINSIHFIQMEFITSKASMTLLFIFSPTRIMENPSNIAITMIWSMLALVIGVRKLDGKILTRVSIKDVDAEAE